MIVEKENTHIEKITSEYVNLILAVYFPFQLTPRVTYKKSSSV